MFASCRSLSLIALCAQIFATAGCDATSRSNATVVRSAPDAPKPRVKVELPAPLKGQDYQLVFEDTFDGPAGAKADATRWSDWHLGKRKDAFNMADTCKLDGKGNLVIEVRRGADGRIETGGIQTNKKFNATHGYYECRCKVLEVTGAWSAFWLQSPTIGKPLGDAVTAGVEIDIFEYFPGSRKGNGKDLVQHNAHWDGYTKETHKKEHVEKKIPGLAAEFRTFAVKWDENGYIFYVDGVESGRWKDTPISNRPEYLILSCEVQAWNGDISTATLPAHFMIDHVRAWQTPTQIEADAKRPDAKRPGAVAPNAKP